MPRKIHSKPYSREKPDGKQYPPPTSITQQKQAYSSSVRRTSMPALCTRGNKSGQQKTRTSTLYHEATAVALHPRPSTTSLRLHSNREATGASSEGKETPRATAAPTTVLGQKRCYRPWRPRNNKPVYKQLDDNLSKYDKVEQSVGIRKDYGYHPGIALTMVLDAPEVLQQPRPSGKVPHWSEYKSLSFLDSMGLPVY